VSETAPRIVRFIVASYSLGSGSLSCRISLAPDEVKDRIVPSTGRREGSWEINEQGDAHADASMLIERVIDRVRPAATELGSLAREAETSCILRIVEYMDGRATEPGFAIDASIIDFLSQVHAFVDADLYQFRPDDRQS
jgi:hypothetical protein